MALKLPVPDSAVYMDEMDEWRVSPKASNTPGGSVDLRKTDIGPRPNHLSILVSCGEERDSLPVGSRIRLDENPDLVSASLEPQKRLVDGDLAPSAPIREVLSQIGPDSHAVRTSPPMRSA